MFDEFDEMFADAAVAPVPTADSNSGKMLCLKYEVDPSLIRKDAATASFINSVFPSITDKSWKLKKTSRNRVMTKKLDINVDTTEFDKTGSSLLDFDLKYGSLEEFQMDCEKVCMNLLISLRINRKFDDYDYYKYVSFISCSNLYGADITEQQDNDLRRIWMAACKDNPYCRYACDFCVYKWEVEMVPALIECFSEAYENGVDMMICSYLCGTPIEDVIA